MEQDHASIPTERMKALYHHFTEKWGEPEHLIWFDPNQAGRKCALEKIHIGVWPSDEECDVNSFVSFGMSEVEMGGSGSSNRAELQFAIRGNLTNEEIHEVARFLANVAEYPFANNLTLDWWHSLGDSGKVPCFPEVSKILFRPSFSDSACSDATYQNETIKFLFIVPLTEEESHIITVHGPEAYENYMEENGFDPLGHK
jgi:hypothetical protein